MKRLKTDGKIDDETILDNTMHKVPSPGQEAGSRGRAQLSAAAGSQIRDNAKFMNSGRDAAASHPAAGLSTAQQSQDSFSTNREVSDGSHGLRQDSRPSSGNCGETPSRDIDGDLARRTVLTEPNSGPQPR